MRILRALSEYNHLLPKFTQGQIAGIYECHVIPTEARDIRSHSLPVAKEQVLYECGNPKHEEQDYKQTEQVHPTTSSIRRKPPFRPSSVLLPVVSVSPAFQSAPDVRRLSTADSPR